MARKPCTFPLLIPQQQNQNDRGVPRQLGRPEQSPQDPIRDSPNAESGAEFAAVLAPIRIPYATQLRQLHTVSSGQDEGEGGDPPTEGGDVPPEPAPAPDATGGGPPPAAGPGDAGAAPSTTGDLDPKTCSCKMYKNRYDNEFFCRRDPVYRYRPFTVGTMPPPDQQLALCRQAALQDLCSQPRETNVTRLPCATMPDFLQVPPNIGAPMPAPQEVARPTGAPKCPCQCGVSEVREQLPNQWSTVQSSGLGPDVIEKIPEQPLNASEWKECLCLMGYDDGISPLTSCQPNPEGMFQTALPLGPGKGYSSVCVPPDPTRLCQEWPDPPICCKPRGNYSKEFATSGPMHGCMDFDCGLGFKCYYGNPVVTPLGKNYIEWRGYRWHEECFRCAHCNYAIGRRPFIPRERAVYHMECFTEATGQISAGEFNFHQNLPEEAKGGFLTHDVNVPIVPALTNDKAWNPFEGVVSSCDCDCQVRARTPEDADPGIIRKIVQA